MHYHRRKIHPALMLCPGDRSTAGNRSVTLHDRYTFERVADGHTFPELRLPSLAAVWHWIDYYLSHDVSIAEVELKGLRDRGRLWASWTPRDGLGFELEYGTEEEALDLEQFADSYTYERSLTAVGFLEADRILAKLVDPTQLLEWKVTRRASAPIARPMSHRRLDSEPGTTRRRKRADGAP